MALPKVYFDVTAGGSPLGRIEMEVSSVGQLAVCFVLERQFDRFSGQVFRVRAI